MCLCCGQDGGTISGALLLCNNLALVFERPVSPILFIASTEVIPAPSNPSSAFTLLAFSDEPEAALQHDGIFRQNRAWQQGFMAAFAFEFWALASFIHRPVKSLRCSEREQSLLTTSSLLLCMFKIVILQAEAGTPSASGIDGGLGHVIGAKRTDIPRELCVPWTFLHPISHNNQSVWHFSNLTRLPWNFSS
jgi:hypothetical protein